MRARSDELSNACAVRDSFLFVCFNVKVITWKAGKDSSDNQGVWDLGSSISAFSYIPV